jgi:Rod binding domain-containing protein
MTIDSATLAYHNRPLATPTVPAASARSSATPTPSATPTQLHGSGARLAPNAKIDRGSALYRQCQEFEQIFVKMMLKEMRGSVGKDTLMSGGYAEEIFQDMLNDEYAASLARSAGFGLADQVYRELAWA